MRHVLTLLRILFCACAIGLAGLAVTAHADDWPARIPLPNGFQPEGIAMGRGPVAYVSSVGSGAIYQVDLHTGEGKYFVEPQQPQSALGMNMDPRTGYLYVAGNTAGNLLVYDTRTGELVKEYQLTDDPDTLINDVAIGWDALYVTDTHLPVFYKVPLGPGGALLDATQTISITGDYKLLENGLNGNGIVVSADGKKLLIDHTDGGQLYMLDAATGVSTEVQVDQPLDIYHDNMFLAGNQLYIVNYNDEIYVLTLAPDWQSAKLDHTITDPGFEAPSAGARRGSQIYVVNARWDAEQTPDTEFWLTRVKR